jgi:NH3-dependent NAD+ synthetase
MSNGVKWSMTENVAELLLGIFIMHGDHDVSMMVVKG